MTPVALPFAVLEDLGGSPGDVGWVIAAGSGTQIAVQLFGGALADRGSRQRQVVRADALAATAQAALATALLTGQATFGLAIVLQVVIGASFGLHHPAANGLIPLVVARERLQDANALLSIAHSVALGLGAAAGGLLAATAGAGAALAVDAASFATSGLLIAGLTTSAQPRAAVASLWRQLREGWQEFIAHRWLWTIVLQFTVMLIGWFGTFAVIGPVVAQRSLGGVSAWGTVAAGFGFGLVAGGFVALRVHFPRPMLAATCACFLSTLLPLLLIAPAPVLVIAGGSFLAGVGTEVFGVLWFTALHTRVAPEALSRVTAYDAFGSLALVPFGEVLAGLSIEAYGTEPTLWAAAALIFLPTAAVLAVPEVRQLRAEGRASATPV